MAGSVHQPHFQESKKDKKKDKKSDDDEDEKGCDGDDDAEEKTEWDMAMEQAKDEIGNEGKMYMVVLVGLRLRVLKNWPWNLLVCVLNEVYDKKIQVQIHKTKWFKGNKQKCYTENTSIKTVMFISMTPIFPQSSCRQGGPQEQPQQPSGQQEEGRG